MTEKQKKELLRIQKETSYPYLIHIHNDDFGDYYFCNYHKDIVYKGQKYTASYFKIDPPEKDNKRIGNATLSFSVVNTEYIEMIRNTQKRSVINIIGSICYEDDTVEEIENNKFTLTNASWDDRMLTWQMVFDEDIEILVPCDVMSSLNCPGCV